MRDDAVVVRVLLLRRLIRHESYLLRVSVSTPGVALCSRRSASARGCLGRSRCGAAPGPDDVDIDEDEILAG